MEWTEAFFEMTGVSPLQGKIWSSNQQAEVHCVDHVLNKTIGTLAHDHWVEAMKSELESIYKNNTWELCDLPKGRKAIATK